MAASKASAASATRAVTSVASMVRTHTGKPYATTNGRIVNVNKKILIGPRGGPYYVNGAGNRVYLKESQVNQCIERGYLPGDFKGVCEQIKRHGAAPSGKRRYGGMHIDAK